MYPISVLPDAGLIVTPTYAWPLQSALSLQSASSDITTIFTNNVAYMLGIFLAVFMTCLVTYLYVRASRGKRV